MDVDSVSMFQPAPGANTSFGAAEARDHRSDQRVARSEFTVVSPGIGTSRGAAPSRYPRHVPAADTDHTEGPLILIEFQLASVRPSSDELAGDRDWPGVQQLLQTTLGPKALGSFG